MKKIPQVLVLAAFAICTFFFACSGDKSDDGNNASSSSSNGDYVITDSSSSNGDYECTTTDEPCDLDYSSDSEGNSSSSPNTGESSSSSSSSISPSSSSSATVKPGANCSYLPIWCGGLTFDKVITASMIGSIGGGCDDTGNYYNEQNCTTPNCVFATNIEQMGNQSKDLLVNGVRISQDGRCGKSDWGQMTCANALDAAGVQKVDGGYYIYVEDWAGQKFLTTGGTPVCGGNGGGTSSASGTSSSSSATGGIGITGSCIAPLDGNTQPPNGKGTCIKKDNKCYICNPDRGNECLSPWLWSGNQVDQEYWFTPIDCNEAGGSSSSASASLTCTGLVESGIAGTAVKQPTVKCGNTTLTTGITWTPTTLSWANPAVGSYTVTAAANCGGSNKTASCGTLTVTAPSSDQLTCTGMPTTEIAGTAITQPTVKCGTSTVTSGLTWTGAPTWADPTANTYTVSVAATCGGSSKTASCGTLKVSPKLTCGALTATSVIAGTTVTPPTVTCGTTTVTSITWTGAPAIWSAPTQGTYNNIQATATSGDCSGQTATCSGKITVTTVVSSSSSAPPSSSSVSGGSATIPPFKGSTSGAKTTRYWDSCKPSCGWSDNASQGGVSACKNCNVTGGTIGNDVQSACNGGSSYTCMSQAPWSVSDNLSYGFAATNASGGGKNCGKCYRLDFKDGGLSGKTMIVKVSNIGGDVGDSHFDIMIPGGGVGIYNALSNQVQQSGVTPNLGSQYGGFRAQCGASESCIRGMCDSNFKNLPDLKAGCYWYIDWYKMADNPNVTSGEVDCPAALNSKW